MSTVASHISGITDEVLRERVAGQTIPERFLATAREHGGDVELRNMPEGGLEATLRLPRGKEA